MTQPFYRDRFTWLAYWMLAIYGYFLNVLGPITPFLKDELRLSYTISSLHFTAFAVGILIVGLGGHWVIERAGRMRSLWAGALGLSATAFLLLLGRSPIVTIGASFLMGLIGSLILAIVPSSLSDLHGERRTVALSEANMIASMLSSAAPLMVGWFAATALGWRMGLGLAACIPLPLLMVFGRVPAPAAAHHPKSGSSAQNLPALYWVYWVAIVLVVSVEFCMIFWSADYLETRLGLPKASAARAVSFFLVAMIVGRAAGSRLVQRFSTLVVVTGSILFATAGFLLYWRTSSPALGQAGLFFTGLGVANLYPLCLSMAIGASGERTAQAGARAALASGAAILALPLILGRLADAFGIHPAYAIVLALLVSALGIVWVARSAARPVRVVR